MTSITELIWDIKYRLYDLEKRPVEQNIRETMRRVANAIASSERYPTPWRDKFENYLEEFILLPGGRILANAGTNRDATLVNTFFIGEIKDSLDGIFTSLKESAKVLRMGGGIGCNFSTIRPAGAIIHGTNAKSPGPVMIMGLWDNMCRMIERGTGGRGAMMGSLSCEHPDLLEFITSKQEADHLSMFNVSILIKDSFMKAVAHDGEWKLRFGKKTYTVDAGYLWEKIIESNYISSEPGVVFIDRINSLNNLGYCERIMGTNSCGEQPLPYSGVSPLASINLAQLISSPFMPFADMNYKALEQAIRIAVRFLDNVIDLSRYPHRRYRTDALNKRRIGLGVTGLADALVMCGVEYGSPKAVELVERWMHFVEIISYESSIQLAKERGNFPKLDTKLFVQQLEKRNFDKNLIININKNGLRNAQLNCVAPTGSISLFAGNISSGIEPIFSLQTLRKIVTGAGQTHTFELSDYAVNEYFRLFPHQSKLPIYFTDSGQLLPIDHLKIQAQAQKHIDGAVSKTINCAKDVPYSEFRNIYQLAYDLGCKGCTTFRPSTVRGEVLLPS